MGMGCIKRPLPAGGAVEVAQQVNVREYVQTCTQCAAAPAPTFRLQAGGQIGLRWSHNGPPLEFWPVEQLLENWH